MSNFTKEEVEDLKNGGNAVARNTWLATWNHEDFSIPEHGQEKRINTFIKTCFVNGYWKAKPGGAGAPPATGQSGRPQNSTAQIRPRQSSQSSQPQHAPIAHPVSSAPIHMPTPTPTPTPPLFDPFAPTLPTPVPSTPAPSIVPKPADWDPFTDRPPQATPPPAKPALFDPFAPSSVTPSGSAPEPAPAPTVPPATANQNPFNIFNTQAATPATTATPVTTAAPATATPTNIPSTRKPPEILNITNLFKTQTENLQSTSNNSSIASPRANSGQPSTTGLPQMGQTPGTAGTSASNRNFGQSPALSQLDQQYQQLEQQRLLIQQQQEELRKQQEELRKQQEAFLRQQQSQQQQLQQQQLQQQFFPSNQGQYYVPGVWGQPSGYPAGPSGFGTRPFM